MIQDTVVIGGECSLETRIEGDCDLTSMVEGDPDVCIGAGGGITPTGTKSILLTEAGTKTEDVSSYASAEINAVKSATASGAVASFSDGAEDVPMDSCLVDIEPVQSGSGDPSPSNVRPISGWSEVILKRGGALSYSHDYEGSQYDGYVEKSYLDNNGNVVSNNGYYISGYIPIHPNAYCYLKNYGANNPSLGFYDSSKNYISGFKYGGVKERTLTTPNDCYYVRLSSPIGSQNYQITYIVENYSTLPISLGQTVYGGTLDVVSGVLTVDRAMYTLTTGSNASSSSSTRVACAIPDDSITIGSDYAGQTTGKLISNYFVESYNNATYAGMVGIHYRTNNSHIVIVSFGDTMTFAEAKTWISNNQPVIVYELATPTTVQLTPTELKTLLGSNSVWADSGDIAVGYKADIFLYAESLETIIDTLTGGA